MIKQLLNVIGWSTNRKIVVIESDDWGSVRMPSKGAYENLKSAGVEVDKGSGYRYNRFDCLERAEDIQAICEVLNEFKDKNGRKPVFTAMTLMGNPDFEKIRQSGFQRYYWEPFTTTYQRYGYGNTSFEALQQAQNAGLFHLEFHGREHLNITTWLKALSAGDAHTLKGFEYGFWGFRSPYFKPNYQAAYDFWDRSELDTHRESIREGIETFHQILGYAPSHFAPPNGSLDLSLESYSASLGIKSLVSARKQILPVGNDQYKTEWRRPGQKNKDGQRYIMRNCFFEPNHGTQNWEENCLKDIKTAFFFKKPAIIGNHRTSFMGGIDPHNRDAGLLALKKLLSRMLDTWPDIEFMTTPELVSLINK